MKVSRFFFFLLALFVIALVIYLVSTPRAGAIPLTGIVTGNDVIVSSLAGGRIEKLLVDEGSEVKTGQLVAEIDPTELTAARDAAAANVRTLAGEGDVHARPPRPGRTIRPRAACSRPAQR